LTGDTSGVLIGRRGQMLDALEYLLNRIAARDEGASARIVVDSENYRMRRRAALEELARRMGEQAKKKRKPVTLNPMSPRDRRIVHMILQEDTSVVTKSSGKGYFRKLIIIPAGMSKHRREPADRE
jgi:spoIIIJ-associated protein